MALKKERKEGNDLNVSWGRRVLGPQSQRSLAYNQNKRTEATWRRLTLGAMCRKGLKIARAAEVKLG